MEATSPFREDLGERRDGGGGFAAGQGPAAVGRTSTLEPLSSELSHASLCDPVNPWFCG